MENYLLKITLLFVLLLPSIRPSVSAILSSSLTPNEISGEFNAPQGQTFIDILTGDFAPKTSKINIDNYHPTLCTDIECSSRTRSRRKIDSRNTRFRRSDNPRYHDPEGYLDDGYNLIHADEDAPSNGNEFADTYVDANEHSPLIEPNPGRPRDYKKFIETHRDGTKSLNTDKFMKQFDKARGNLARESKLIKMARWAQSNDNVQLTGDCQAIFHDVINSDGLTNLYATQSTDASNAQHIEAVEKRGPTKFQHWMGLAIGLIPMIDGAVNLAALCRKENSTKECHHAAIMFGLGLGSFVVQVFVPMMLQYAFTAHTRNQIAKLATFTTETATLEHNLSQRLAILGKTLTVLFTLANLGFEAYGIYELSSQLNECLNRDKCSTEIMIRTITGLTLAVFRVLLVLMLIVVAMNPIYASMIFVGIWILEKLINAIYSLTVRGNKYNLNTDERKELFLEENVWAAVIFFPVVGIMYLTRNKTFSKEFKNAEVAIGTVNHVIEKQFEVASERVVAIAYAYGRVDEDTSNITSAETRINMSSFTTIPKRKLLRVQPDELPNTVRLCLPNIGNTVIGEWQGEPIKTAQFDCENAVVVGRKGNWSLPNVSVPPLQITNFSEIGQIIYLLDHAMPMEVIGCDFYHNHFVITNNSLGKISGGALSNTYSIKDAVLGDCEFTFHSDSEYESFDLTSIADSEWHYRNQFGVDRVEIYIEFELINDMVKGYFKLFLKGPYIYPFPLKHHYNRYKNIIKWKVSLKPLGNPNRKKIFVGIRKHSEHIQCADSHMLDVLRNNYTLAARLGGGVSTDLPDKITNCHHASLKPFTIYEYNYNKIVFFIEGDLEKKFPELPVPPKKTSTIHLVNGAQIALHLTGAHLFVNTVSIKYSSKDYKLIWDIIYETIFTSLTLEIYGFYRNLTEEEKNRTIHNENTKFQAVQITEVHDLGMLRYEIVTPEPDATDDNTTYDVNKLNIYSKLNSTSYNDAMSFYQKLSAKKEEGSINVTLILRPENSSVYSTFIFGDKSTDLINIDGSVKYVAGGNGEDTYTLFPTSPEYIWIDNNSSDNEMDHLTFPKGMCSEITVERYTGTLAIWGQSDNDVIVQCSSKRFSHRINVILKDYITSAAHRHLLILTQTGRYAILLDKSIKDNATIVPYLGDYIDMRKKNLITGVNSASNLGILHVSDKNKPLDAYIQDKNIVLLQSDNDGGLARLLDVYEGSGQQRKVRPQWKDKVFVVVEDTKIGSHINWTDIERMVNNTTVTSEQILEETMKSRYAFFNAANKTLLRINHDSQKRFKSIKIPGVLNIRQIMPASLLAKWDSDHLELQICATNSCVIIENWCQGQRHRISSIEFNPQYKSDTITIPGLEFLECEKPYSNQDKLIKNLNTQFQYAQKLAEFSINSATDLETFKRCILIAYAQSVTDLPTHGLFGFNSAYHSRMYYKRRCPGVIKLDLLTNLTHSALIDMFESNLIQYKPFQQINYRDISDEMKLQAKNEEKAIDSIKKSFKILEIWYPFKYRVYEAIFVAKTSGPRPNFEQIDIIKDQRYDELPWYDRTLGSVLCL